MKRFPFICAMILCLGLMAVPAFAQAPDCIIDGILGTPVSDDGIEPIYTEECTNPTCADLGYAFEVKVDPPNAGDYIVGSDTISVTRDGDFFDWSSTFGIDAVIAKGGSHANIYVYDPADTADGGLAAPSDCGTGAEQCGLSHISFCYDDICDCESNDDCDRGNECEIPVCNQECTCDYTYVEQGISCETDGVCDGSGNCEHEIPVPEFPTIALPAIMVIGFLGAVLFIQGTRKQ